MLNKGVQLLSDVVGRLLIAVIWLYKKAISPLLGQRCRFEPTCSVYAMEAIRTHGPIVGGWLAFRRLFRCHPWGGQGFDPVPPRKKQE